MYISSRSFPTDLNFNGRLGNGPPFEGPSSEHLQRPLTATLSQNTGVPFSFSSSPSFTQPFTRQTTLSTSISRASTRTTSPNSDNSLSDPTTTPSLSTTTNEALRADPTADATFLAPTNGLVPLTDGNDINSGAIIGATLGSLLGFVLIVILLDIILLSSRIQRIIKRSPLSRFDTRPPLPPLAHRIRRKPLPSPPVPFYHKEIKRSRSLSVDSAGYSESRYSRSTWGWSGGVGSTERDSTIRDSRMSIRREMLRKGKDEHGDMNRYSVFDEDDADEEQWKAMSQKYSGRIRPGMGVQRRYTGSSFFEGDIKDYSDDIDRGYRGRREAVKSWVLQDSLERWRRGLHPLTGSRGKGMVSIGYF